MAAPKAHAQTTVTIASGGTTSTAANISPRGVEAALVGIRTPAALTGTSLTFEASNDGSTFLDLYNASGAAVTVTAAADRHIALDPADFAGVGHVKVVSGSAEAAARDLILIYRSVA